MNRARVGSRQSSPWALVLLVVLLGGCGGPQLTGSDDTDVPAAPRAQATASAAGIAAVNAGPITNPILFVTQVPIPGNRFPSRLGTFATHIPDVSAVPRGGDLMIRYPDGSVRNLTKEAGFGQDGFQLDKAIAVREPSVHWSGTKAIFSMLVGAAPKQFQSPPATARWQLYEVGGLGQGQAVSITKVAGQPAYNNVSPFYASDDRILFTSDLPRRLDAAHLYPLLDEYESTPTVTGLYSLDPATGTVAILNHAPSGVFSPGIDSFGRIVFTRWDHLQRDQQAESDDSPFGPFDWASEAPGAAKIARQPEVFPESRNGMGSPFGPVNGFTMNLFTPWQMHQDGSDEVTLNHIGRHELEYNGFLPRSFANDPQLTDASNPAHFANRKNIREDGGLFHLREDPLAPGVYYGIYAREFGTLATNQIVRLTGAPSLNAEQMTVTDASPPDSGNGIDGGRFRNPLPMSTGHMVATYTPSRVVDANVQPLRLHQLLTDANGKLVAGPALTPGTTKSIQWWSPDAQLGFNGLLWEVEAVEVVARVRPPSTVAAALPAPEKAVLSEEQVDEAQLRAWLKANQLALIVTRNQTSRDRGDRQQPYNLQVPGGTKTVGSGGAPYEIAHYQVFQANYVRGYDQHSSARGGRRPIAQPIQVAHNVPNPNGPAGSVRIAADGSTAAFVPASRALTWQTTNPGGAAVVRERMWVTMQPGEIRTCTGCHGSNTANQAGQGEPQNKPEALRELVRRWKQVQGEPIAVNGSAPLLPPPDPQGMAAVGATRGTASPAALDAAAIGRGAALLGTARHAARPGGDGATRVARARHVE